MYIAAEVLELAGNVAQERQRASRINADDMKVRYIALLLGLLNSLFYIDFAPSFLVCRELSRLIQN